MVDIQIKSDNNELFSVKIAGEVDAIECVHVISALTNIFAQKLGVTLDAFKGLMAFLEESEINMILERTNDEEVEDV